MLSTKKSHCGKEQRACMFSTISSCKLEVPCQRILLTGEAICADANSQIPSCVRDLYENSIKFPSRAAKQQLPLGPKSQKKMNQKVSRKNQNQRTGTYIQDRHINAPCKQEKFGESFSYQLILTLPSYDPFFTYLDMNPVHRVGRREHKAGNRK